MTEPTAAPPSVIEQHAPAPDPTIKRFRVQIAVAVIGVLVAIAFGTLNYFKVGDQTSTVNGQINDGVGINNGTINGAVNNNGTINNNFQQPPPPDRLRFSKLPLTKAIFLFGGKELNFFRRSNFRNRMSKSLLCFSSFAT